MEPIWVLVSEPTTLVDRAATSALFSPEIAVVESDAAWVVVSAPSCPVLRPETTEATCVLVRALTCVLLSDVVVSAPSCVVESWETLPAEKPAGLGGAQGGQLSCAHSGDCRGTDGADLGDREGTEGAGADGTDLSAAEGSDIFGRESRDIGSAQ